VKRKKPIGLSSPQAGADSLIRNFAPLAYLSRMRNTAFDMRILIVVAVATSIFGPACAQTQPTRPSAYATVPTMRSAFPTAPINPCYRGSSFNPTSPCYSGTMYPSYSAVEPFEFPKKTSPEATLPGANSLDEGQAKSQIEAKGYSNVSGLQKDNHGIWRGKGTMEDGRSVAVILDLQGNIYSELSPSITIRPFDLRSQ
jgi:hypothetical protein